LRGDLRIGDADRSQRAVPCPVVAHDDALRRHAAGDDDRLDLAQGVSGGALVAAADRQIDHHAAGRFAPPALREGEELSPLRRRQLAAVGADEHLQGAVGFADRNRVPHPVVGRHFGDAGDLLSGVAPAGQQRTGGDESGAQCRRRDAAASADHGADGLHRRLPGRRINQG
jgi:hypothetical protein